MISGAYIVAGIGYGDEGKGHITNYLTWKYGAKLNVRYNGGPQAAHNVLWVDSGGTPRHHTFSQFGAGTPSGASTYLSRFMLIEPLAMAYEAEGLENAGIQKPFLRLFVDRECPVITPYHAAMNRLREAERRDNPHGTCGAGFGEAMGDYLRHGADLMVTAGDLIDTALVNKKMRSIQDMKLAEAKLLDLDGLDIRDDLKVLDMHPLEFSARYRAIAGRLNLVDRTFLQKQSGAIVFEGAQGALLHQDEGFQPHTTWSDTSMRNAITLLDEARALCHVRRIAVTRSYMARHGAGPLVTEHVSPLPEEHNPSDNMQGVFRTGDLDLVALTYGAAILGGNLELAVTHADKIGPETRLCTHYRVAQAYHDCFTRITVRPWQRDDVFHIIKRFTSYGDRIRLTQALGEVKPISHPLGGAREQAVSIFRERVEHYTRLRIGLFSYGSSGVQSVSPLF